MDPDLQAIWRYIHLSSDPTRTDKEDEQMYQDAMSLQENDVDLFALPPVKRDQE